MLLTLALTAVVVSGWAIATDTFRAGWAFSRVIAHVAVFVNPPPDRDTRQTVVATPRPRVALAGASASPDPAADVSPDASPGTATPATAGSGEASRVVGASTTAAVPAAPATARPKPTIPVREAVKVSILKDPQAVFAHELQKDWCAVAGTQMVLAILGRGDTSDRFQRQIAGRIGEWESRKDSRDGGWGPAAIAEALAAYGEPGYEIRAYRTRDDALMDAALAISETQKPVVLLTWYGAHTWVMTGYRADADPLVFPDAKLTHAQILDPRYPWVSSIWGASSPPGHYEDMPEMQRNYLRWARPEGSYPDRDGMFIAVVPTAAR